jgi:hypothetical protein
MPRIVMVRLEANDGSFAIAKTMRECLRERILSSAVSEITTEGSGETHANRLLEMAIKNAEL